ncbi:thioredoxin domain-containing protein [Nocardioides anomalus]|uniref:Thioredoxin domain-containing protein n=1 Tax=Nocardioides anomalus TaxID=2712223 RepID=A0A6G6WA31_9ACTN|nr:thioredoxin domain-containing protein [Nocardioides anomalus]QIG42076.1 thioredoxin domain-containing protein [Nocardioides anomalus]
MASKTKQQQRAERAAALLAEKRRQERRRQLFAVVGVVVAIAVIIGAGFLIQSLRDTSGEAATAPGGTSDGGYGVVVGDASAPKTVTVYEDFQCPICHEFEKSTRDQLRAAVDAGKIKIDYRMVSFLDKASTNQYSSRALNAAAVVLDTSGVDTFVKYHDLLFDNQPEEGGPGPSNDELVKMAVQAGAEESAVKDGIENGEFDQWVTNTRDEMSKNGVTGTPTVFVDGKKAGSTLGDAIDAALAAAG